jgi:hypothetical protein
MSKKNIVFDFDGVIHSYTSGWQGDDVIPDPPVHGIATAIKQIREYYRVVIVSTRCASEKGMKAIAEYLNKHGILVDDVVKEKPPAVCYIDDRAICFDGHADTLLRKVLTFKPWYERSKTDE